ncbi:MAG: hypothetical protein U0L20_04350 [Ruminococcus sp.]|nr:hypothetical protein [Ruminococcus sp.]
MTDNENIQKILKELSGKIGMSESQLKNALNNKNTDDVVANLDDKRAKQLNDVLSDPEKTRAVLNSPQAQALIKLLGGE